MLAFWDKYSTLVLVVKIFIERYKNLSSLYQTFKILGKLLFLK